MLTSEQQKWVDHLSDTDTISIVPFDQTAEEKFIFVKERIRSALGAYVPVEHHGAASLGISGQDEIDIYVPIPMEKFDAFLELLKELFGEPRSTYPLRRARFVTDVDGKHADVFLITESSDDWLRSIAFETHLKNHPDDLDAYRKLKERSAGLSVREYYRRKIEFINGILKKSIA